MDRTLMKEVLQEASHTGFNNSQLVAVYRRLWDLLPPSVWISVLGAGATVEALN